MKKLLPNISRLLTCGCSFTAGQGLEHPTHSWPFVLAEMLNLNCTNLAFGGTGNDFSVAKIIDYYANFPYEKSSTFVAIGLTAYSRIEFIEKNGVNPVYTIPGSRNEVEFNKMIFTERFNSLFYYYKYLRTIILLQELFKSYKVSYIFFNALQQPHEDFVNDDHVKLLKKQIDMTKIYNFEEHMYTWINPKKVLHDGHPNKEAYYDLSLLLNDFILDRYGKNS